MATALNTTVPCSKCDNPAAKFHCDTCRKALCAKCKTNHLKSKGSRHHVVVEYAKKLNPKYLTGILCHTHKTSDPELWCDTCSLPICMTCITEKHKGHEFSKLTTVLSAKRDAMRDEMKDIRDGTIKELEEELKEAQKIKADYLQDVDKTDKDLVARAEEMIKQVQEILSQNQTTLREMKKSSLDKLNDQEKYLADRINNMKADVQKYEDCLQHGDQTALLQFKPGMIQLKEKQPTLSAASIPVFIKGQNDAKSMQKIFGQLSITPIGQSSSCSSATQRSLIPNPFVQSEFDVYTDYPCIACVEGGLAWVKKHNKLQLVDRDGTVKETTNIEFDLTDVTVTSDGDLLLSDGDNKCIKLVSKMKTIRSLFCTISNRGPEGLCYLHNGDVVVTFAYDRKVTVYSRDGEIRRTFNNITFRFPIRVAVNKVNQDIYICDLEDDYYDYPGKLIAVRADSRLRYEYTGQGDNVFTPAGVCTDLMGNVLIADYSNHRVHILDQEGQFIQYILTLQQGMYRPTTLDVDREGYVWVGGDRSEGYTTCVRVSRYLC